MVEVNNKSQSVRLPGGVLSLFKDKNHFIERGNGGHVWDNRGKEYIDMACGYGSIILGHANPEVCSAIEERTRNGTVFVSDHPLYYQLAEMLQRVYAYSDVPLFHKTGSEAVAAALRLARAYTGRKMVIRCGFHGWHDEMVSPSYGWHSPSDPIGEYTLVPGTSWIKGEPPAISIWDGCDADMLRKIFKKNGNGTAALLLDPIQLRPPLKENFERIVSIVHDHNALLILDETKTCFRTAINGVQGLYGINADITILGKALANGQPLSAVLARPEIADLRNSAKIMGTYNGELTAVAAANATVSVIIREQAPNRLDELGAYFIELCNKKLSEAGLDREVEAIAYRWPCMPYIKFEQGGGKGQALREAFQREMVDRGVLFLSNHPSFVCMSHSITDIDFAADAAVASAARAFGK